MRKQGPLTDRDHGEIQRAKLWLSALQRDPVYTYLQADARAGRRGAEAALSHYRRRFTFCWQLRPLLDHAGQLCAHLIEAGELGESSLTKVARFTGELLTAQDLLDVLQPPVDFARLGQVNDNDDKDARRARGVALLNSVGIHEPK